MPSKFDKAYPMLTIVNKSLHMLTIATKDSKSYQILPNVDVNKCPQFLTNNKCTQMLTNALIIANKC